MDLSAVKERIRREKKKGDIAAACKRARVSEHSAYRNAMAVDNFDDLTSAQEMVLFAMLDILDKRIKNLKKATSCVPVETTT